MNSRRPAALAFALVGGACAAPAATAAAAPPAASAAAEPRIVFEGVLSQGGLVLGTAPAGTTSISLDGKPVALSPDRRFVIGLDRDQPATATLAVTLSDGRTLRQELRVAPRAWRVEHIGVAQRPSVSSEEYRRLRERELGRINAARALRSATDGWRQRFAWPSTGRISGLFGAQRIYRGEPGAYHSGVDVAAGAGAPVASPADGVVVLAGPPTFSLEGNLVIIDHGMGLNSAFLHLASVTVREGQKVRRGQAIGTVGSTGRATGPHLHWSVKWHDARLDPQLLAGAMPD